MSRFFKNKFKPGERVYISCGCFRGMKGAIYSGGSILERAPKRCLVQLDNGRCIYISKNHIERSVADDQKGTGSGNSTGTQ